MHFSRTWFNGKWVITVPGGFRAPAKYRFVEPFWILISTGGVLALTASFLFAWLSGSQIAREHGPMENLQAGFLAGGLLALFYRASQEKIPGMRIARAVMAWGYFIFLIIEFDVRPFQVKWMNLLLNGAPRNIFLVLGSVVIAAWVVRNLVSVFASFRSWLRTVSATLLVISAAFWLAGGVAERWAPLSKPTATFLEELLETNATWLMMLATLASSWEKRPSVAKKSLVRSVLVSTPRVEARLSRARVQ